MTVKKKTETQSKFLQKYLHLSSSQHNCNYIDHTGNSKNDISIKEMQDY